MSAPDNLAFVYGAGTVYLYELPAAPQFSGTAIAAKAGESGAPGVLVGIVGAGELRARHFTPEAAEQFAADIVAEAKAARAAASIPRTLATKLQ